MTWMVLLLVAGAALILFGLAETAVGFVWTGMVLFGAAFWLIIGTLTIRWLL